jgi:NAD/NADP transhydrogenase beta subunit
LIGFGAAGALAAAFGAAFLVAAFFAMDIPVVVCVVTSFAGWQCEM